MSDLLFVCIAIYKAFVNRVNANRLCGSYEALKGGQTSEAMVDFTGGVCEIYELDKWDSSMFQDMLKFQAKTCLMGCSIS